MACLPSLFYKSAERICVREITKLSDFLILLETVRDNGSGLSESVPIIEFFELKALFYFCGAVEIFL